MIDASRLRATTKKIAQAIVDDLQEVVDTAPPKHLFRFLLAQLKVNVYLLEDSGLVSPKVSDDPPETLGVNPPETLVVKPAKPAEVVIPDRPLFSIEKSVEPLSSEQLHQDIGCKGRTFALFRKKGWLVVVGTTNKGGPLYDRTVYLENRDHMVAHIKATLKKKRIKATHLPDSGIPPGHDQ